VDAVLVRPLPYPEPERILQVWGSTAGRDADRVPFSHQRFLALADQGRSFASVAAWTPDAVNLTGVAEPEQLRALRVSQRIFDVLGVPPALGRGFNESEETKGGPGAVLLSHPLFESRFGSDPSIVGRSISLNGTPHTVVGVLPAGIGYPATAADLWIPRVFEPGFMTEGAVDRGAGYLDVVARLRPGVKRAEAQAELDLIPDRDKRPEGLDANLSYASAPLGEPQAAAARPTLFLVAGAVGFVLLIACANVANLLLALAASRGREIALRAALGASRGRLFGMFLGESLVLALAAGAVGVALARGALALLASGAAAQIPRAAGATIDLRVLVGATILSLLTGILFGLAPAVHASRADLNASLREAGPASAGGTRERRTRSALVVAEVGLSIVLLIGAGLMVRSFIFILRADPGFDPHHILVAELHLPPSKYPGPPQIRALFQRVEQDLSAIPGVVSVGSAEALPLAGTGAQTLIAVDGGAIPPPGERSVVSFDTVSPGFFRTLGIRVTRGRAFTDADDGASPIKIVVSEEFARRFFPGTEAVGRHAVLGKGSTLFEIIGVVTGMRDHSLDSSAREAFYLSSNQRAIASMSVMMRTAGEPLALAGTLRARLRALDADLPIASLRTMDDVVSGSVAGRRYLLTLVLGFALLAASLAGVGIYSVTSYWVSRRRSEIGIRMALGAEPREIVRLVVGSALRLTLAGVALGAAGGLALGRLLSAQLYGVGAADPLTFTVIAVALVAVAVAASALPALRAARIDPWGAIRHE